MTRKRAVYGKTLGEARAVNATAIAGAGGMKMMLTFEHAYGPAGMPGRELIVMLDCHELAAVLGAVPAIQVSNLDDRLALARVMRFLHQLADAAQTPTSTSQGAAK